MSKLCNCAMYCSTRSPSWTLDTVRVPCPVSCPRREVEWEKGGHWTPCPTASVTLCWTCFSCHRLHHRHSHCYYCCHHCHHCHRHHCGTVVFISFQYFAGLKLLLAFGSSISTFFLCGHPPPLKYFTPLWPLA